MRPLLASALVLALAACGRADRAAPAAHGASSTSSYRGPDLLVLRVPRGGGTARVVAYQSLDSLVWSSPDRVPAVDHILGFDEDAGTVAFVDAKGRPGWLDLRQGTTTIASRDKLTAPVSLDGAAIYGVAPNGTVARFTPTGSWTLKPPRPVAASFPQGDGSLILLSTAKTGSIAWRVRPPGTALADTLALPAVSRTISTQLGDRIYLVGNDQLVGVRTRTFDALPPIALDREARAVVATPSGDRLFVADSTSALSVIDRYQAKVSDRVTLPAPPADLRMDPFGRYLLARATTGDSAWVVALASGQVIGSVRTAWRDDIPFVGADGGVVLAEGNDVVVVDGETLRPRTRVAGGASDLWFPFVWTGFRPRAGTEPVPVTSDSIPVDSTRPRPDSALPPPPADSASAPPPAGRQATGFTVQLASMVDEQKARDLAATIRVGGEQARVVPTQRAGMTVYHVVLGPYPTREQAEQAGKQSGQNYWVYEGAP